MLDAGLLQHHGFGRLLEEIDRRSAAKLKGLRAYVLFQLLRASVHEQNQLQLLLEPSPAGRFQAPQIDELKLAGERKELADQAIARERRGRVGEQAVLELEANLSQAILGRYENGARLGAADLSGEIRTTPIAWLKIIS